MRPPRPLIPVERRALLASSRDTLGQIIGKFGQSNPISELAGQFVGIIERYEATVIEMESKTTL